MLRRLTDQRYNIAYVVVHTQACHKYSRHRVVTDFQNSFIAAYISFLEYQTVFCSFLCGIALFETSRALSISWCAWLNATHRPTAL